MAAAPPLGWRCPNGHFPMARKLGIGHQTWHGSGTTLGVAVTIPAKSPKLALSTKIGWCTAVTLAVTFLACVCLWKKMAVAPDSPWW